VSGEAAVGNGVLGKVQGANVVFCQLLPYDDACRGEGHNLKRARRRSAVLLTRLLANMGVAGSTLLLKRFSTPVARSTAASVVKNGDFSGDADGDGTADGWVFSSESKQATCRRERMPADTDGWALVLTSPRAEGGDKTSTMLAQHDVPVEKGQWYRVSFQARAERLEADNVTMTITNTTNWRSLFPYQRFQPGGEWKRFSFEVQSNDTAERRTRLQIWYGGAGKLWLCDIRVEPMSDPTQGRWLEGLYLDVPEEWDDPYRFFRW
jgi:hypothetical protein